LQQTLKTTYLTAGTKTLLNSKQIQARSVHTS